MNAETLDAVGLTLRLAVLTTILLLLISTPIAWWLARTDSRWRPVVVAIVTLPLVLPPTVLGFYLLLAFGPEGPIGMLTTALGLGGLSFTFAGLLVGSLVFSLPFAVQPLVAAFESVGRRPMEVAATLRASPLDAFFSVAVPLARPGFLTAAILSFAHTVGEFGVVMMIGGNIPGLTRVVSTEIYGLVEAMRYDEAHALSAAMVALSFAALIWLGRLGRRRHPVPR